MSDTVFPLFVEVDGEPRPALPGEWAKHFGSTNGQVGHTEARGLELSTIFTGINRRWRVAGDPLIYESAVRAGSGSWQPLRWYCTRAQARRGHELLAEQIYGGCDLEKLLQFVDTLEAQRGR